MNWWQLQKYPLDLKWIHFRKWWDDVDSRIDFFANSWIVLDKPLLLSTSQFFFYEMEIVIYACFLPGGYYQAQINYEKLFRN